MLIVVRCVLCDVYCSLTVTYLQVCVDCCGFMIVVLLDCRCLSIVVSPLIDVCNCLLLRSRLVLFRGVCCKLISCVVTCCCVLLLFVCWLLSTDCCLCVVCCMLSVVV